MSVFFMILKWLEYFLKLPLRLAREQYRFFLFSRRYNKHLLDMSSLKERKTSERLFVLGSSVSINGLTEKQWGEIKANDSFGFNNWLLTGFVPTYYMVEPDRIDSNHDKQIKIIECMLGELSDTVVLFKDTDTAKNKFSCFFDKVKGGVFFKHSFFCSTNGQLGMAYRLYDRLGLMTSNKIFFARASVFTALYIGYILGYKEIVFVGVDLNSTEYFYDNLNSLQPRFHELVPSYPAISKASGGIHSTTDPKVNPITVDSVLLDFYRLILKPKGIKLSVINDTSALYPALPLYK